jgi:sugar/nucleoside kinase (ribokinase family)
MACKTLARLSHGEECSAPPVVSTVVPLCMIGDDNAGNTLLRLLEDCGSLCENVDTRVIRSVQAKTKGLRTALSILPIYKDGRRGCFFDAASNSSFSAEQLVDLLSDVVHGGTGQNRGISPTYRAFLFGYPHLLPLIQGQNLSFLFREARRAMVDGGITALDLNGVPDRQFSPSGGLRSPRDLVRDSVIGPALEQVDILHMNEDELALLTGCRISDSPRLEEENQYAISKAVELFLACGVAIVAVTRGKTGCFVACNNADRMHQSPSL